MGMIQDLIAKYLPQILNLLQQQATQQMSAPSPDVQISVTPDMLTYKLTRKQFRSDGIFSELADQNGNIIAHTLEHSYDNLPKITNGTWKCVRGPHRLNGMTEDFITFEITGIVGHSDLLFHWGNYNKDSEGCCLLGEAVAEVDGVQMVINSKATFAKFMAALNGINEFMVIVS